LRQRVKAQDVLSPSAANTNAQSDDLSVATLSGTITKDFAILFITSK
jgi:hypothetical protein